MLVLDFAGNAGRHQLVTAADILGGNYSDETVQRAKEKAKASGGPCNVSDLLEQADRELVEEEEQRLKAKIVAKATYVRRAVSAFEVLDVPLVRSRGVFASIPPTTKQRTLLMGNGFSASDLATMSSREASQVIDAIMKRRRDNLCSVKQAKVLAKYGERTDVSFAEASRIIDAIAKNGWNPLNESTRAAGGFQETRALSGARA
jgi:hypothetical protein